MKKALEYVHTLRAEKEDSLSQVSELESKLAELKSQLVEPLTLHPSTGPFEAEEWLKEEAQWLQKELKNLQNSCTPRCRRMKAYIS
jgi:hypothetical protein